MHNPLFTNFRKLLDQFQNKGFLVIMSTDHPNNIHSFISVDILCCRFMFLKFINHLGYVHTKPEKFENTTFSSR